MCCGSADFITGAPRNARLQPSGTLAERRGRRPLQVRQKAREDADRRQERADLVHELDARAIRELTEDGRAASPAIPNAKPKKTPEIMPTRPGTSSCA